MLSTINENKLRSVLHLAPENNVIVACRNLEAGEILELEGHKKILLHKQIPIGHKVALVAIKASEKIIKFGVPIGSATTEIPSGDHVHTQNMKSDYIPTHTHDFSR